MFSIKHIDILQCLPSCCCSAAVSFLTIISILNKPTADSYIYAPDFHKQFNSEKVHIQRYMVYSHVNTPSLCYLHNTVMINK